MDSFELALPRETDRPRLAYDFDAFRAAKDGLVAELEALEADASEATSARVRRKLTGLRNEVEQDFHRFEWAVFGKVAGPLDRETVELGTVDYMNGLVEVRGGDLFIGRPGCTVPQ